MTRNVCSKDDSYWYEAVVTFLPPSDRSGGRGAESSCHLLGVHSSEGVGLRPVFRCAWLWILGFHHVVLLAYQLIKGVMFREAAWWWTPDLAAFSDLHVFLKKVASPGWPQGCSLEKGSPTVCKSGLACSSLSCPRSSIPGIAGAAEMFCASFLNWRSLDWFWLYRFLCHRFSAFDVCLLQITVRPARYSPFHCPPPVSPASFMLANILWANKYWVAARNWINTFNTRLIFWDLRTSLLSAIAYSISIRLVCMTCV